MARFTELLSELPAEKRSGIRNLLNSDAEQPTLLRANLDELWPEFADLADPDFLQKFGIEPNQRAWEMHVGIALRRANIPLTAPTPGRGPDFLSHDGESRVWIEAVTAHPGDGDDRVPQASGFRVTYEDEDRIALRLANALDNKARKLDKYIEDGIVGDRDKFVIALCSSIPYYPVSAYHVARAVFAIGGWELERDPRTREPVSGFLRHQGSIQKTGGCGVPTDGFMTPRWQRISGIIFSCGAFPLSTAQLGREFSTVQNYVATKPLKSGWLRFNVDYRITEKKGQRFLTTTHKSGARLPDTQNKRRRK